MHTFSTASSIVSLVTLARIVVGAAIFFPWRATRPTPAIPAFAHGWSEVVKIVLKASS